MIPLLAGWELEQLVDAFSLTHPSGGARVFYRERGGRPKPVGVLVRMILAGWPHLTIKSTGPLERLYTAEGEAAATLALECEDASHPVSIVLGFVITDELFTSIAGVCRRTALADEVARTVRELVRHEKLALGARRRRFEYRPPTGWQPSRQGLVTEWLPPGYPRHATSLVVHPATPHAAADAHLDALEPYIVSAGCDDVTTDAAETGTTRHGMPFEARTVRFRRKDERRCARVIVLADQRYQYPIELRAGTSIDDTELRALADLVDSIVAFEPTGTDAFTHWIK